MLDTSRHLHFTHSLEHYSRRLNDLLQSARLHPTNLSPELLDEIAYTIGELTIVLMNHSGCEEEELIKEVLSQAHSLRLRLRSNLSGNEQIMQAIDPFRQKIGLLITESKQAA